MKKTLSLLVALLLITTVKSASILIPMDETQTNHLKAYGIAWHVLDHDSNVQWLLNYRGGSFLFEYSKEDEQSCLEKGVKFETLPDVMVKSIIEEVKSGNNNKAVVEMQRAPRIAVYAPANESGTDAVVNVLNYSGIPYEILYDNEVLRGDLTKYDWLHSHHEDFTGQYGRFWAGFRKAEWYKNEVKANEATAQHLGYVKVSQLKLAVAKRIRDFVGRGGFMFAMCSATDSYDIALAAEGIDICDTMYDGDDRDMEMNSKLKYENCFAFTNFQLRTNSTEYEFSNIDTYSERIRRGVTESNDYFTLNKFSCTLDIAPVMLTQNHVDQVKGFWGQTTGFEKKFIKPGVRILGENAAISEARYIHGDFGKGRWTFYGGHDPEDYQNRVGEAAPDLAQYPNSPGYRLILNNVLFQSTRTEEETHASFSAYPSPASTSLFVTYTIADTKSATLNIYDAAGKLAYSEELKEGSTNTTIDVSSFTNGTYLWKIENANEILHSDKFSVLH